MKCTEYSTHFHGCECHEKNRDEEIQRLTKELSTLRKRCDELYTLLEESSYWLCPHDKTAQESAKKGVRGFCIFCNSYVRGENDATLFERVNNALQSDGGRG